MMWNHGMGAGAWILMGFGVIALVLLLGIGVVLLIRTGTAGVRQPPAGASDLHLPDGENP